MSEMALLQSVVKAFAALATQSYDKEKETAGHDRILGECCVDFTQLAGAFGDGNLPPIPEDTLESLLCQLEGLLPSQSEQGSGSDLLFPRLYHLSAKVKHLYRAGAGAIIEQHIRENRNEYHGIFEPLFIFYYTTKIKDKDEREVQLLSGRITKALDHLTSSYRPTYSLTGNQRWDTSKQHYHKHRDRAAELYYTLNQVLDIGYFRHRSSHREVRFGLVSHLPPAPSSSTQNCPTKFEVLLPNCEISLNSVMLWLFSRKTADWRVAQFEVNSRSDADFEDQTKTGALGGHGIAKHIATSGPCVAHFCTIGEELHPKNPDQASDKIHSHINMDCLHQLLGNVFNLSPKAQLMLSLIVANSFTALYPGPCIGGGWGCAEVFLPGSPTSLATRPLAPPYLAAELGGSENEQTSTNEPHSGHDHPKILYLGILLLEIATGKRFERSQEPSHKARFNIDRENARNIWKAYKNQTDKLQGLMLSIKHCLFCDLTSNCPGQIQEHVFLKIMEPIRGGLQIGFGIPLERLEMCFNSETYPARMAQGTSTADGVDTSALDTPFPPSLATISVLTTSLLLYKPNLYYHTVLTSAWITSVWYYITQSKLSRNRGFKWILRITGAILVLWWLCILPTHLFTWTLLDAWTDKEPFKNQNSSEIVHNVTGEPIADVFAIHGLGSNPDNAWTYRDNNKTVSWLSDILPLKDGCDKLRIITLNHPTRWDNDVPRVGIEAHAERILRVIENINEQKRPIIFIAHSFGGLLLKQALVEAARKQSPVAGLTKGILFLGVPHYGTKAAFWASLLSCTAYWRGSSYELLQIMAEGSATIEQLDERFREAYVGQNSETGPLKFRPLIHDFVEAKYEKIGAMTIGMTVDYLVGKYRYPKGYTKLLRDHRGLNKFRSLDDLDFQVFFDHFKLALERVFES